MFIDEAFQLLHFLSKYPNLIVYVGDEKYLKESFYQQMDILESLIEPFNGTSQKWIYVQIKNRICPIVPQKLEELESFIQQQDQHGEIENKIPQPVIQFEHVINASKYIHRF